MRLVARIGAAIADIAKRRGETIRRLFEAMFALACCTSESECEWRCSRPVSVAATIRFAWRRARDLRYVVDTNMLNCLVIRWN